MASTLVESISRAASAAISGMDVKLDATTGTPHDMASRIGRPNPSYKVGYKRNPAQL